MIEEWRAVPGYEGFYEVSNKGRVRSIDRYDSIGRLRKKRYIKLSLSSSGYFSVGLSKKGKVTIYLVHRLVAQVFIPNPDGLPQVNHKDCDVQNNRVDNLEWCDSRYNTTYGDAKKKMIETKRRTGHWGSEYVVQKMKESGYIRPVKVTFPDGRVVICESQTEVADLIGVKSKGGICWCLKGVYKTIKGCKLEFV